MKKVLLGALLVISLSLVGCSNSDSEKQAKTIDSLEKVVKQQKSTIDSLTKEQGSMAKLKNGESETLSGTVVIGEDLEPGSYDITLPGDSDGSFSLFINKQAKEENKFKHEWLFPKSNEKEQADELKSYSLKSGNILDIDKNLVFTKIR
ncbi:TPA: hypothetical protein KG988_002627 [Enterococcus faecalis]|uniref:hypothetical protein n=1 Tax=Lactobacillales TaxID=186826 RepID=UPI000667811F|nr:MULTISPECIES: hypothetical protein [Lactobacillales]MCC4121811.1 hypothetical protein [Lactococcus lactis]RNA46200.1 hypothetical protein QP79_10910 [Enterococcus faecalis]RNA49850.1 hypothetical protein QP80_09275 [Enterococcus faecalis]RNA53938.1 hypothetical protein QP81_01770 [Enterococcus faecalis]RNA56549.1 hypothetical protein QP82_05985 [Enterococcus faecalis]